MNKKEKRIAPRQNVEKAVAVTSRTAASRMRPPTPHRMFCVRCTPLCVVWTRRPCWNTAINAHVR